MTAKNCTIALRSINNAIHAKELLSPAKMHPQIKRLNPSDTKYGCGYGISVSCDRLEEAKKILIRNGISFTDEIKGSSL